MCTDLHKFVWMFQAKNINKYDIHWLYSVVSDGFCVVYTLEKDRSSKDRFFFFSTTFFFCIIKIEAMKNKKPFATILRNLIEISRLKIPAGYHLYLYQLWFFLMITIIYLCLQRRQKVKVKLHIFTAAAVFVECISWTWRQNIWSNEAYCVY